MSRRALPNQTIMGPRKRSQQNPLTALTPRRSQRTSAAARSGHSTSSKTASQQPSQSQQSKRRKTQDENEAPSVAVAPFSCGMCSGSGTVEQCACCGGLICVECIGSPYHPSPDSAFLPPPSSEILNKLLHSCYGYELIPRWHPYIQFHLDQLGPHRANPLALQWLQKLSSVVPPVSMEERIALVGALLAKNGNRLPGEYTQEQHEQECSIPGMLPREPPPPDKTSESNSDSEAPTYGAIRRPRPETNYYDGSDSDSDETQSQTQKARPRSPPPSGVAAPLQISSLPSDLLEEFASFLATLRLRHDPTIVKACVSVVQQFVNDEAVDEITAEKFKEFTLTHAEDPIITPGTFDPAELYKAGSDSDGYDGIIDAEVNPKIEEMVKRQKELTKEKKELV